MTIAGIICEYNPFHNGHKYHIEATRKEANADIIVALMSGNYVQRGDVAIFDKETRAKTAILNGADLVIELPTIMSLCSAERFAKTSIDIFNALGIDYLSFGAENEDLSTLLKIAKVLNDEPSSFKEALSSFLSQGLPFALARGEAMENIIPNSKYILSTPNNILAIEYLKALFKTNSTIKPLAIKRLGGGYNSAETNFEYISATACRELISGNRDLSGFVPDNVIDLYKNAKIHRTENMEKAIIANLCKMSSEEISQIADVSEGLENKIKKEAFSNGDFTSLCEGIKSKRYALSRIKRILLHAYLGIKKVDLSDPLYIKILDFNEKGQGLLNSKKQEAKLPLVKNFNQIKDMNNPIAETIWKNELLFDRIYDLF